MHSPITWKVIPFSELTTTQLYQLLKLRTDIFVVEQKCAYPELDNKDHQSGVLHILGYIKEELIAYTRILPPGINHSNLSISRVALKEKSRGNGFGHQLITKTLIECETHFPRQDIKISAQEYLINVYKKYNFTQISKVYLDDGIPHIDMILKK